MTPTWQSAALALATDLRNVFGDRLRSVVAYGPQLDGHADAPLTCLALVSTLTMGDLGRLRQEFMAVLQGIFHPRIQYPAPTPPPTRELVGAGETRS